MLALVIAKKALPKMGWSPASASTRRVTPVASVPVLSMCQTVPSLVAV
jgi:hypothetical protein